MSSPRWRFGAATIVGLIIAVACNSSKQSASRDAGGPSPPTDSYPDTPLGRVAAIVIPNCAMAGCHDAVSKTHNMDLSTPEKIVSAWVNQTGFDHCTGLDTPRVIPGDAAGSLVIMKIEGIAVCLQSNRMPLPPRDALSAEQIDVIRSWIAAGAPSDHSGVEDAGADAAVDGGDEDGGLVDAGDDATADGGEGGGGPVDGDGSACTAALPCWSGLSCYGDACSDQWQCLSHFDETLEHPCELETTLYCGCDGVTFEASITCPDRPFSHPGACGDGESCFTDAVRCADPAPVCPEGQAPSVVDDCYGPCIPVESCRCFAHYQCPNLDLYTCLDDMRCGPNPRLDAGADAAPP
jgi:hypothetical protein